MPEYTLGDLSNILGATLRGGDSRAVVSAIAPLADAANGDLSFLADPSYRHYLSSTKATAVLLAAKDAEHCPVPCLIVDNPAVKFVQVARLFERKITQPCGIHSTAVISEGCSIDPTASIGAHCVIGHRVIIGKNTLIFPGTVIGDDVEVGEHCLLHANVTLYSCCLIGSRVIIHSGAVIGSDGFGNINQEGKWLKAPQLGRVRIANDVEIGANTTIDCGALGDTIIDEGVKLDNLIQIGHNVHIGAHTAMAAQVGVAGSTRIGKYCMLGGKAAINGHITIGDHVILTAITAVSKSIVDPGVYSSGIPAEPYSVWSKNTVRFTKLNDMYKRLLKLEKAVEKEV